MPINEIERVAWVFRRPGHRPLVISGQHEFTDDDNDDWTPDGWIPAVEVQPVLDALWSLREKTNFERETVLVELIRQLEETKKP